MGQSGHYHSGITGCLDRLCGSLWGGMAWDGRYMRLLEVLAGLLKARGCGKEKTVSDSAAFELPFHALLREPLGFCNLFGSHASGDIVSIFLGLLLLVTLHVYGCEAHP